MRNAQPHSATGGAPGDTHNMEAPTKVKMPIPGIGDDMYGLTGGRDIFTPMGVDFRLAMNTYSAFVEFDTSIQVRVSKHVCLF